jgi:hypothetical protein
MTRKIWLLIAVAILLGAFSIYLNKDWFAKDNIQIYHRSRPARVLALRRKRVQDDSLVDPIVFGFDRQLKLTSLKVIPTSDIQTNKFPHPIWHLISESNSVPTKDFTYGASIKGMHSAVKGATPDLLEPGVAYRLYIETGTIKKEHDFVPTARTP